MNPAPDRRHRLVASIIMAGLLALGLLAPGCGGDSEGGGPREVDPRLGDALARSDTAAVRSWVREEGGSSTRRQIQNLDAGLSLASEAEYRRTLAQVRDPILRLATIADQEFDLGLEERFGWSLSLPFERRLEIRDLNIRRGEVDAVVMPANERERILRQMLAESRTLGSVPSELATLSALGRCLADQTRNADALQVYREALALASAVSDRWYELQFLGVVGHYHEQDGDFEGMREAWEAGIRIADSCRIADQAARLRVFLANHYALQGRYSIARELLDEATACVRDPSGRDFEMRLVQREMEFHARLECWEVVDGLLERQEEILRNPPRLSDHHVDLYRSRYARLAARRAAARGDSATAAARWNDAARLARMSPNREEWPDVQLERARAALDAGRLAEEREAVEEAVAYAESNNLPRRALTLRVLAGAAAAGFDAAAAEAHLDAFARGAGGPESFRGATGPETGLAREWALHDATRVRLALAAGDSATAVLLASRGAERARRIARTTDPSGAGYLLLEQLDPIWRAGDDALGRAPIEGLRWEMRRRELRTQLGADLVSSASSPEPDPAPLAHLQTSLLERNALLVVWRVGRERVDVWLVSGARVLRDQAPASAQDCRVAVEHLVDAVARGGGVPESAAEAARAILPPTFRERIDRAATIYFCPDGFVALAPLELLPDGAGVPLIDHRDTAVVRFHAPTVPRSPVEAGAPLVVGPPALPAEVTRRWPTLANLDGATREARTVAALLDDARLLEGGHASKPEVLERWETGVLHVSAHFVRDPLVPFVTFVPLAAVPGGPREAGHLDILDVRRASFTGTRLVVLSGCGSGAPWIGTVMAPGLGEAFLDAGAHAVVQTRWEVDDAMGYELVTDFARRYARAPDPVAALNAAKREARGRGVDPFDWATYSIVLAGI